MLNLKFHYLQKVSLSLYLVFLCISVCFCFIWLIFSLAYFAVCIIFDFPAVLVMKNLLASTGGMRVEGSIPGLGRSSGEGHGNPLQYSCLENPTDRGAWQATVHGITKSWTRLKQHSTHRWKESQKQLLKVKCFRQKVPHNFRESSPSYLPLGHQMRSEPPTGDFLQIPLTDTTGTKRLLFDLPYLLNS